ncbi:cohesin loading factor-domain-containing protein [Xylaria intraflava]|nr:cohesin loading factor-domain-containing protein [Xylaria intraflava]
MTYHPNPPPPGHPPGPQQSHPQHTVQSYNWTSPHTNNGPQQFRPAQYQNNANFGTAVLHPTSQHQSQPQPPTQIPQYGVSLPHLQPRQQPQANYQLQGYDSSSERPYAHVSPQTSIHMSAQMMQPLQTPFQASNPYVQQQQQQQQQPQQQQQQTHRMDWQHTPSSPAVTSPSPSPYSTVRPRPQPQPQPRPQPEPQVQPQAQSRPQPQPQPQPQHQPQPQPQPQYQHQHISQHISSPVAVHSPQLQHQPINSPIMPHSPRVPPNTISSKQHRMPSATRIEQTPKVSASPRLMSQNLTRSPSVSSTRSPALAPALIPHHQDTASLLICMADEFFTKARRGVRDVAAALNSESVHEYQKMIATGLACLEAAIGSNKLAPRLEALARLQYASVLCAETNNVMEAEMALTKGITLCERNRFADLNYCMQFQQVQLLFSQHKEKAALIAVDARIRDAEVVKHTHWVYVFRFLKTSFYLQSSNPTEAHALENLRAITILASQRGDRPIFAIACLLEALSHLRAMKDDAIVRIQACIAQASKYQLEDTISIMQLDVLQLVLDLACSLQQKSPHMITKKLQALQDKMDSSIKDVSWGFQDRQLLLPLHKQATNQHVISADTSSIIKPGENGGTYDYLAMSFWSKLEAFTTTYTYSGLALMYQQHRSDKKLFSFWEEALSQLQKNRAKIRGFAHCLEDAVQYVDWERETTCYLHILRGLHLATSTNWDEVKVCVTRLENLVAPTSSTTVALYSMYLAGVYYQGTGNLEAAINIYSHPRFSLNVDETRGGHHNPLGFEAALLAAFNLIWIMQDPHHRNDQRTQELLEQIRPLCMDHPNMEIRTAYNLVMAAIQTNPPIPMTAVKTHISAALSNAKNLADVHTLSMALNLMRAKLFQSIVGDQALKSAKAASAQARRSGNTLWMSVADGMLSQSYEVQGALPEAQKLWQDATYFANKALKTNEE